MRPICTPSLLVPAWGVATLLLLGASSAPPRCERDAVVATNGLPPGAVDGPRHRGNQTTGELRGMGEDEVRDDALYKTRIKAMWSEATGGRANFGLGTPPAIDPLPAKAARWAGLDAKGRARERERVREQLMQAVIQQSGGRDPRTVPLSWNDVVFTQHKTLRIGGRTVYEHQFRLPAGHLGMEIVGRIVIPQVALDRFAHGVRSPAVIYQHYHGGAYSYGTNELFSQWDYVALGPPVRTLTEQGFIVIATDVHGFNERRPDVPPGPAIDQERLGIQNEFADTRQLTAGGSAHGAPMSRFALRTFEDFLVFRLLRSHPMVEAGKIGSMGMSMGCVRTFVLAALAGDDLAAGVAAATFPRFFLAVAAVPGGIPRIFAHRNSQTFLDQFALGLDTEEWLFAAGDTNMKLQIGANEPSSPGSQELFALAAANAAPGVEVDAETPEPGTGHTWTAGQMVRAIDFLARKLAGTSPLEELQIRAGLRRPR